jgi:antitoxin component of MazEF toxin-antitoxin module
LGLTEGSPLEIDVGPDRAAVVMRKAASGLTLDDLVQLISPENVHGEALKNFVGKERW